MNGLKKKPNLTRLYTLSEGWVSKPKIHKTVAESYEDWSLRLKIIRNEAEIIKVSLQSKDKDLSALNASNKEVNKKFKTLCKEVQKLQKTFAKKREEMQTKVLFVIDTLDSPNKTLLDATRENCKKVKEALEQSRVKLNNISNIIDEIDQQLKTLGQTLAQLMLPQSLESSAEVGQDLKDRLDEIHRTTLEMVANGSLLNSLESKAANDSSIIGSNNGLNLASASSSSNTTNSTDTTHLSSTNNTPAKPVNSAASLNAANGSSTGSANTSIKINSAAIQKHLTMIRDNCTASVKLIDLVAANVQKTFPELRNGLGLTPINGNNNGPTLSTSVGGTSNLATNVAANGNSYLLAVNTTVSSTDFKAN